MTKRFWAEQAAGRVVIYTPVSGDPSGPFDHPELHLDKVDFCSDWDYYTPLPGFPSVVSVAHNAVAADTGVTFGSTHLFVTSYVNIVTHTYTACAHGGGGAFVPGLMASLNGFQYPQGAPVQTSQNGGRRMVSFYCDATNVYVYESCRPGPVGLPAITLSYRITAFINTADKPGEPLFYPDLGPNKRIRMGKGRIDTDNPVAMRDVMVGDTNILALPTSETVDLNNGRIRLALSDGTVQDVGPLAGTAAYHGNFTNGLSKQVVV